MESKIPSANRYRSKSRGLAPRRLARPNPIIASGKLSERKLRQLIRCYADGRTPKEAMEACGLSHVTVRKMYRQIRERLVQIGLYEARIAPGAPDWWQEQERPVLLRLMRESAQPHQAVRDDNLPLYFAEAAYRREAETSPAQLYRLILAAVADLGPLNRPPKKSFPTAHSGELLRLAAIAMRRDARKGIESAEFKSEIIGLIDEFEARQNRILQS